MTWRDLRGWVEVIGLALAILVGVVGIAMFGRYVSKSNDVAADKREQQWRENTEEVCEALGAKGTVVGDGYTILCIRDQKIVYKSNYWSD